MRLGMREYNLPWSRDIADALMISFLFLISPAPYQFPVKYIFGAGVLLYFAIYIKGPNQLGMSLKISKKTVLWIVGIALVFLALYISIAYLAQEVKQYAAEHPEEGGDFDELIEFHRKYFWQPGDLFYEGLSQRNFGMVASGWIRPFLHTTIFAPLFETVIYFGILFPALWKRYGHWRAVIIVTILFVLIHFPDMTLWSAMIISTIALIMISLYRKTGSIYPSIIFHACYNFTIDIIYMSIGWGLPYNPTGG